MQLVCKYMQLTESAAVSETWEILTSHRSRRAVVCEKTEEPETKQLWIHFLKSQEQLYLGSTKWHLHQENAVLKKQREHEQRKLSSGNIIMRGEEREREKLIWLKQSIDILEASRRSFILIWVKIKWVDAAAVLFYQDTMRFHTTASAQRTREGVN